MRQNPPSVATSPCGSKHRDARGTEPPSWDGLCFCPVLWMLVRVVVVLLCVSEVCVGEFVATASYGIVLWFVSRFTYARKASLSARDIPSVNSWLPGMDSSHDSLLGLDKNNERRRLGQDEPRQQGITGVSPQGSARTFCPSFPYQLNPNAPT